MTRHVCAATLLAVALWSSTVAAQQGPATASRTGIAIAFVDVNVIAMDDDLVRMGQTVVVQNDRILAVGPRDEVAVPEGATVIAAAGRYLVPGLTDAHVHLVGDGTGFGTARPDFGDAPLYLTHGVTTVVNLRGTPVQLDWRRRIENGELVGPTIYTAGEFVNEPRVMTPDDVVREIEAQAAAGYDLVKFHEVFASGAGNVTTTGLSHGAYLAMNDAARASGVPLVGHAPVNLGLETMLQARQSLAHAGMLSNIYFLPMAGNRIRLILTASALVVLMVIAVGTGLAASVDRWRALSPRPRALRRVRMLVWLHALAGVCAVVSAALFLPGGPMFESVAWRVIFTLLSALVAIGTLTLVVVAAAMWRESTTSATTRAMGVVASIGSLVLASAALVFWVPVAWRSADSGIEHLAQRVRDAGITVQTTLVNYDAIGGPGRMRLLEDPAIDHLSRDIQARWRRLPPAASSGYRYTAFMQKVVGALHRAGVPLVAGTDAMGYPLVTPGSSLHRELELLVESGLTPYEALYAATVAPARFLGREAEFGRVATGQRADLLLVDGNPLEDVTRLREPAGVMARGRWHTRDDLQRMLAGLAQTP